jgi:hypothetical protein
MSLEIVVEKNNELLARENALLEQQNILLEQQNSISIADNELKSQQNALMAQFISALTTFRPILPAANDDQSVVATIEQPTKPKKSSVKKAVDNTPVDIETLDLEGLCAIAVLFKTEAYDLTSDKLAQARAVIEGVGEEQRNGQVDALDCALQGLPELKALTNVRILDLCLEMVENWDDISGITERREFALALLNEGKQTSDTTADSADDTNTTEPEPEEIDYDALYSQLQTELTALSKAGYHNEAVSVIHAFGAKTLGTVPKDKIQEALRMAETIQSDGAEKATEE